MPGSSAHAGGSTHATGAMSQNPSKVSPSERKASRDELKAMVAGYKGFGMLSLIRVLLFRSPRSFLLGIVSMMLLIGQWLGPVGFVSAKFVDLQTDFCPGGAPKWARCVMCAVALIYFARLSIQALSHVQERPAGFSSYKMPRWWGFYRNLDLVVTSLLYDTCIFMANLLIVFDDRHIPDMVVDVLALEFFTIIDDEFKRALMDYDDSFLDDMMPTAEQDAGTVTAPLTGTLLHQVSRYSQRSSSWRPGPAGSPLAEALFDFSEHEAAAAEATRAATSAVVEQGEDEGQDEGSEEGVGWLVKAPLGLIRFACRVVGPLFAACMVVYGPWCLGT